MNYLSAENVTKSVNDRFLFKNIHFGIDRGQKIALIGTNGTGKTTLLKLIAGVDQADEGKIALNKSIRVGYLDQDPEFKGNPTVMNAIFQNSGSVIQCIKNYELALQNPEKAEALQDAIEKMDQLQAWDYEEKVKQIISKMGITDLQQTTDTLSGGQRKRLALAALLIEQPDLLLLDEPTNHLDLSTIEWLENFLQSDNTTLLMITHDRYFLDGVCKQIIELENGQLFKYNGNYAYFLEKKSERETMLRASTEKARNLMKKELEWMRRQPKARGTKAKYRIDAFYELQEKANVNLTKKNLQLDVKETRQGNQIAELENIAFSYGSKEIIKPFSYVFKKQQKIGIIGNNGSGKSTFLNLLTGKLIPTSGHIITGTTTQYGYFTQSNDFLPGNKRIIEMVKEIAEYITLSDGTQLSASKFLEQFLFTPEKQYTFIEKLSGGEKKRLQLLTTLIKSPNFLILDEPTNDFDLDTLNILEDFLSNYNGSLLLVSHDRYFMDNLVEELFVFNGNGEIEVFNGNYTDYRSKEEFTDVNDSNATPSKILSETENTTIKTTLSKLNYKEKKELEQLDIDIPKLEADKNKLIEKMNSGITDHKELQKLSDDLKKTDTTLESKTLRWMELSEKNG